MQLLRPDSVEAAAAELGNGSVGLAGGTDLVPLLRDRIVEADTLVELRGVVPRGVQGTTIGAGTTLAELEADHADPAGASRGLLPRRVAAAALDGDDRREPPPGDALLVLAAEVPVLPARRRQLPRAHRASTASTRSSATSAARLRTRPIRPPRCSRSARRCAPTGASFRWPELYRLPTEDDRNVTALEPGELILELDVPKPEASTYLKAMDRTTFSFALVGVGAARFAHGVRLALAGVAPIPWQLDSPDDLERATPLPGTAFKVELARPLIRRALEALGP